MKRRDLVINYDTFLSFELEYNEMYFKRFNDFNNSNGTTKFITRSDWIRSKFPSDLDIICKVVFLYDRIGGPNRTVVILNCDEQSAIQLLLTYDFLKEKDGDSNA